MRRWLDPLVQLAGPALLVVVVGLVSTTASPSNEVYFLNALVAVAIVVLVGVVVGGIDRPWTATLGGFAIGFVSGLLNGLLPTDKTVYLPSAVFALVILVLLLRPAGLFTWGGRAAPERV